MTESVKINFIIGLYECERVKYVTGPLHATLEEAYFEAAWHGPEYRVFQLQDLGVGSERSHF